MFFRRAIFSGKFYRSALNKNSFIIAVRNHALLFLALYVCVNLKNWRIFPNRIIPRRLLDKSCKPETFIALHMNPPLSAKKKGKGDRWNVCSRTNYKWDILAGISKPRPRQRERRKRAHGKMRGRKKGERSERKKASWTERGRYSFGTTAWLFHSSCSFLKRALCPYVWCTFLSFRSRNIRGITNRKRRYKLGSRIYVDAWIYLVSDAREYIVINLVSLCIWVYVLD